MHKHIGGTLIAGLLLLGLTIQDAQAGPYNWHPGYSRNYSWRNSYYAPYNGYSYVAPSYRVRSYYVPPVYNYGTYYGPAYYGPGFGVPYSPYPSFNYQYQYWYGY